MELKGFEKFDKILNEIKTEAPKATERFLMLQAEELKKDVKDLTPVDTGALKNSWQRENGKRLTGKKFTQIVFNMTDYAAHVEYGHRIGRSKTKFVRGRFMLRTAVAMRQIKFYKDLKNFYGGLIKK
ncbi:HK97 gp10 family phage protein [Fusobacterium animalis]|uniref:HK97 gp10 family phage protein n=1 Tax=Fusobacterium animalis TaxID=76859 RepID=UPI001C6E5D8F|nr:HK97 gp10 family phage protein [Fusobacterium animalis]QYR66987.1 HK97 gp10 family phage protein [Fusobacterium animalis]